MGAVLRGLECCPACEEELLEAVIVVKPFVLERLNLWGRWAGGVGPEASSSGPDPAVRPRYRCGFRQRRGRETLAAYAATLAGTLPSKTVRVTEIAQPPRRDPTNALR
jgi:hypothetical protein